MSPFPTDIEPPPEPWWRRLLPGLAIVVLGSAGYGAAAAWPSSSAHTEPHRADIAAGGRVLVYDDAKSALALVAPNGAQYRLVTEEGSVDSTPVASLDGRVLVTDQATVARFRGGGFAFPHGRIANRLGGGYHAIADPPVTDDGRVVVVGGAGPERDEPLQFFDIATGKPSRPFGTVDAAAGDPNGDAALVSIPDGPPVSVGEFSVLPDSQVQRVTAAGKRTVLVGRRDVARSAGRPLRAPCHLVVYPSPDGGRVAIAVQSLSGAVRQDTVMVVNRSGRVLDTLTGASSSMVWSPDSSTLAVLDASQRGLVLWQPGNRSRPPIALSTDPAQEYFAAAWSPDGREVLCVGHDPAGEPVDWAVVRVADGRVDKVRYAGFPLAWYPGAPR